MHIKSRLKEFRRQIEQELKVNRQMLRTLKSSERAYASHMDRSYVFSLTLSIFDKKFPELKPGHRTAKKVYDCKAYEFIQNAEFWPGELTFSELRAIAKAKQVKGKILPGETYLQKRVNVWDEPIVFRAKPELHDICLRFELYQI